ncbi:hypothetical protein AVEN_90947-1 [Araneus ventricosus]|uniref:Uncharacterized protein n=1 Tax=Araneus ventricosus TaxID=182803 RepID=A0A4Y2GXA6_ARAVE|nr:hypothetical protein AVEN_90947-1 [Araneus ventricosus]
MTRTTHELPAPSLSFRTIPAGGHLAPTDLACTRPAYTAVLRWNRDSNLQPSDPETLPPGHRVPCISQENKGCDFPSQFKATYILNDMHSYVFHSAAT